MITSFFGQFRLFTRPVFGSRTIQSGMSALPRLELSYVRRMDVGAKNWVMTTVDVSKNCKRKRILQVTTNARNKPTPQNSGSRFRVPQSIGIDVARRGYELEGEKQELRSIDADASRGEHDGREGHAKERRPGRLARSRLDWNGIVNVWITHWGD